MISGYILKKISPISFFDDKGNIVVATLCHIPDLTLTQIKTVAKDGYPSLQFGYGTAKKLTKPLQSKLKKQKIKTIPKHFLEFRLINQESIDSLQPGQTLTFDQVFSVGDKVNTTGKTKGRGFAGVIKRYNFHRQPVTMGASDRTRSTGAIGAQTPGKVVKGKRMPGHFGNTQVTIKNLTILSIEKDKKQVIISGSIPGHSNSWFLIKRPKY